MSAPAKLRQDKNFQLDKVGTGVRRRRRTRVLSFFFIYGMFFAAVALYTQASSLEFSGTFNPATEFRVSVASCNVVVKPTSGPPTWTVRHGLSGMKHTQLTHPTTGEVYGLQVENSRGCDGTMSFDCKWWCEVQTRTNAHAWHTHTLIHPRTRLDAQ